MHFTRTVAASPRLTRRRAANAAPLRRWNPCCALFTASRAQLREKFETLREGDGVATPAVGSSTPDISTSSGSTCASRLEFPCLDQLDQKTQRLMEAQAKAKAAAAQAAAAGSACCPPHEGVEPSYVAMKGIRGYKQFNHSGDFFLDLGGKLSEFTLAYETWGKLNADRSNAILLHTGLSASSHARSHPENEDRGWWEDFIGPGAPLDTDKFFVVCANSLGGCHGSTGPSSRNPATGLPYATSFPFVTIWDIARSQQLLVKHLGIHGPLHASVGASMGGMLSQAYSALYPDKVRRLVTISSCARAHPYSIALRFVQRQVLMADPAYAATRGDYYGGLPPHVGMKLARGIGTITYRSGPEWERRFGRKRVDSNAPPSLCPDFSIESYLDHQGEKFSMQFDANSLLWLSKAMDLFDMGASSTEELAVRNRPHDVPPPPLSRNKAVSPFVTETKARLQLGMQNLQMPTLVLGVNSDILFPLPQQAEVADVLRLAGNKEVTYYVLDAEYGHDTFLIDRVSVGAAVAGHLAAKCAT